MNSEIVSMIKGEMEEQFYLQNKDHFYNLHLILKEYCEKNAIPIYDKPQHSNHIMEFIKIYSTVIDDMVEKEFERENPENEDDGDYLPFDYFED